MTFKFSGKSLQKLEGVHPDLVKVVKRALELSTIDFSVLEGVRTSERQKTLVSSGKSFTMQSKHIVQADGYGHAVDLVPHPISWLVDNYYPIAEAIQKSAKELNVKIKWGGSWCLLNTDIEPKDQLYLYIQNCKKHRKKVFIDAPHFELVKRN